MINQSTFCTAGAYFLLSALGRSKDASATTLQWSEACANPARKRKQLRLCGLREASGELKTRDEILITGK